MPVAIATDLQTGYFPTHFNGVLIVRLSVVFAFLLAVTCGCLPVLADEPSPIAVTLQDHKFTPSEIQVPAGKPTVLVVTNRDAGPEEFDSSALKVEKVIVGGATATIRLRPLGPGHYPFMGEYHPATAKGVVTAQ